MRNSNINLGQYDMVLALSESKINYEFNQMLKRGVISKKWQMMSSSTGKYNINNTDSRFEEIKKAWLMQDDEKKSTGYSKYVVLIDATLDAPQIKLIKGNHTELLFKLVIKEGNLHYIDEEENRIAKCSLKGQEYAFKVPISKLRIKSDAMHMVENETMDDLREEGLNDNDFLIDAIFLDFQRANISHYSLSDSILPPEPDDQFHLQAVIANYFKNLKTDKDNPYILGYTINKKKLAPRDKALLFPTGASFSTSFSKLERASAFNFLLLTEHHQFPDEPKGGRIDSSLIEEALDKSATVSGVIAIDFETFKSNYLSKIKETVADVFAKSFKDLGYFNGEKRSDRVDEFRWRKGGATMLFSLKQNGLKDAEDKQHISMNYTITVEGNVHEEKSALVGTVGIDQKFSTKGQYHINGKKGMEGKLVIKLIATEKGKIKIEPAYEPPIVGRDTDGPEFKDNLDRFWSAISDFFSAIAGILNTQSNNLLDNIEEQLKSINFFALEDFSNKVVLPGSNVYTFKNIRLLNTKQDDSDAVLFDIAYAIATE